MEIIICILIIFTIEVVSDIYILKYKNTNCLPNLYSIDNDAIFYSKFI